MRHQSAENQTFASVERNVLELRNLFNIDQCLGLIKPLLHQNRDMRAAGKNFGFTGMLLEHGAGLSYRRRFEIVEILHAGFMKMRNPKCEIRNKRNQNKFQPEKSKTSNPNHHCLEHYIFY